MRIEVLLFNKSANNKVELIKSLREKASLELENLYEKKKETINVLLKNKKSLLMFLK
jgi:hypothetical protein